MLKTSVKGNYSITMLDLSCCQKLNTVGKSLKKPRGLSHFKRIADMACLALSLLLSYPLRGNIYKQTDDRIHGPCAEREPLIECHVVCCHNLMYSLSLNKNLQMEYFSFSDKDMDLVCSHLHNSIYSQPCMNNK